MWPTSFPAALSFIRVIRAIRGQKLLHSSGLLVRDDGAVTRPSAGERKTKGASRQLAVVRRQQLSLSRVCETGLSQNRQLNNENSAARRRGRFGS